VTDGGIDIPGFPYMMPDPNAPPPAPIEHGPTPAEVYAAQAAEYIRLQKAKPKGRKRTPKVEELYGALIKAGAVRIVRRKGRPPLIVWL
jgi:hypothetical protein